MASLAELNYFVAVAKTLNVSRAAELCGISQPALSHALKRLEGELATPLLLRGKTGVRLTRAGEKFAAQSKVLMEDWNALTKSVQMTDKTVSGHFNIGCHCSVAIYSLPLFLPKLQTEYPELNITLRHGLSREIAGEVIEYKTDFGLVINPPRHPDLVIRELGADEVTLWVRADGEVPATLILEPNLLQTQSLMRTLEKRKLLFDRKLESTNLEVIHALTLAGCGVGILPTRVAKNPNTTPLKLFSAKSPVFKDKLCLIYRAGTQNHASGRAIVSAIINAGI